MFSSFLLNDTAHGWFLRNSPLCSCRHFQSYLLVDDRRCFGLTRFSCIFQPLTSFLSLKKNNKHSQVYYSFLYRERCWSKGNNQNTTFQFVPIGIAKLTIQNQYFSQSQQKRKLTHLNGSRIGTVVMLCSWV